MPIVSGQPTAQANCDVMCGHVIDTECASKLRIEANMAPTVREPWYRDCISSVSSIESKLTCNTCFDSVSFV